MERRKALALIATSIPAASLDGCQAMKVAFSHSFEIEQKSSEVIFRGYGNSVRVNASPETIVDLFRTPEQVMRFGVFDRAVFPPGSTDLTDLGHKAVLDMRVGGIDWRVPFTDVKSIHTADGSEMWFASIVPTLHVQKWRIKRLENGSRVDFQFFGEPPRIWGGRQVAWTELIDPFTTLFDNALAHLKALFDPEFDREAYMAEGAHGELFDVIFQRYNLQSRLNSSPAEVYDYLVEKNGIVSAMGEDPVKATCMGGPQTAYCPYDSSLNGLNVPINRFTVKTRKNRLMTHILTWSDYMAAVELKVGGFPGSRRSSLQVSFTIELPRPGSEHSLDLTIGISKLPERMLTAAEQMKRNIEISD